MTQFTIDFGMAQQLQSLQQQAELRDPSGKVVGRFVPLVDLTQWEPLTPEISDEELTRREQANERRYTTKEVLEHLEKL